MILIEWFQLSVLQEEKKKQRELRFKANLTVAQVQELDEKYEINHLQKTLYNQSVCLIVRKRQRMERFGGATTQTATAPVVVDPAHAQKLADRAKRFASQP